MDAQTIDLLDRGMSGTGVKRRFENRDRFAAQATPVDRGTRLEFSVKLLRKFFDQQSRHGGAVIPNR